MDAKVNLRRHLVAYAISLSGLLVWVCLQVFTERGHFEGHDVGWTLIGGGLFQVLSTWRNRAKRPA